MRAFILTLVVGLMSLGSMAVTPTRTDAHELRASSDTVSVRWRGWSHYQNWRGGSRYYYPNYYNWGGTGYYPRTYYNPSYYYNPGYNYYYSPAYPNYNAPSYRYFYRPGVNVYWGW